MKKLTVLLSAVLAAAAVQASDSSITLYGVIDNAIALQNSNLKVTGTAVPLHQTTNTIKEEGGNLMANRWGIKGVEDLGILKVGFVLENGFSADTGTTGYGGRMFGRESQLYVKGNYGTMAFGRVGPFTSGNGSYNMLARMSPYGNQIAAYMAGTNSVMSYVGSRVDDSVTYVSPNFGDFSFRLQYSGRVDALTSDVQNKASVTRYGAVGFIYQTAQAYVGLIGDITLYGHEPGKRPSNGNTVTLGGNYNFGAAKLYVAGQYYKNVLNSTFSAGAVKTFQASLLAADKTLTSKTTYLKGFGLVIGVDVPLAGGVMKLVAAYMDGKSDKDKNGYAQKIDFERFGATVGYNYDLSKRTTLYTAIGYQDDSVKLVGGTKVKQADAKALFGLCHRF